METRIEEMKLNSVAARENSRVAEAVKTHEFQKQTGQGTALTYNVPATEENLRKVDAAVKALEIYSDHHPQTRFQYRTDTDTGRIQVTLVNFMTGEVVEEIPSKKLLEFSARLEEMVGLVLEKRA